MSLEEQIEDLFQNTSLSRRDLIRVRSFAREIVALELETLRTYLRDRGHGEASKLVREYARSAQTQEVKK